MGGWLDNLELRPNLRSFGLDLKLWPQLLDKMKPNDKKVLCSLDNVDNPYKKKKHVVKVKTLKVF